MHAIGRHYLSCAANIARQVRRRERGERAREPRPIVCSNARAASIRATDLAATGGPGRERDENGRGLGPSARSEVYVKRSTRSVYTYVKPNVALTVPGASARDRGGNLFVTTGRVRPVACRTGISVFFLLLLLFFFVFFFCCPFHSSPGEPRRAHVRRRPTDNLRGVNRGLTWFHPRYTASGQCGHGHVNGEASEHRCLPVFTPNP